MRLRGKAKYWLYGTAPFYRGWFPYYGHQVYFPRRSVQLPMVCDQGIYEESTVRLVSSLARPSSTYIDVGANIGLLSLPVLENCPDVSVISLEASPETLSYLTRTQAGSRHRQRWNVTGTAVGKAAGTATFWSSTVDNGAFDGFKDTGRGGNKQAIEVAVKTLDELWSDAGRPAVSVIKIDVEGAELDVLAGATQLLASQRPAVVVEWTSLNLPAYQLSPGALLTASQNIAYKAYSHPAMCLIDSSMLLDAAMAQTETFLLLPA
jgi:FkbM family methyltransferase